MLLKELCLRRSLAVEEIESQKCEAPGTRAPLVALYGYSFLFGSLKSSEYVREPREDFSVERARYTQGAG